MFLAICGRLPKLHWAVTQGGEGGRRGTCLSGKSFGLETKEKAQLYCTLHDPGSYNDLRNRRGKWEKVRQERLKWLFSWNNNNNNNNNTALQTQSGKEEKVRLVGSL